MQQKSIIMILTYIFIIAPIFCWAVPVDMAMDELARQITTQISNQKKRKVAVLDFSDLNGQDSKLGKFIAEEILTRLVKENEVSVVERMYMKKVLQESEFRNSGIVDIKSAQKIGRFLGADSVCLGTLTPLQKTVRVNARLIDSETGKIFAVATASIDRSDDINVLLGGIDDSYEKAAKPEKPKYKKGNLMINGDFSREYEGWNKQVGDITKGYSQSEIIAFAYGRSGKALHIRHKGEGNIKVMQLVPVPSPDLIFSASFQVHSHEGMMSGFSGSGVVQIGLVYMDEGGNKLGETLLVNYVKNPFADTPLIGVPRRAENSYQTHFVEIEKGLFYKDYQINLKKEIEDNIMGFNSTDIRQVAVILWCGATHSQAGSELWVTDMSVCAK
jgi:TolB-like protein